MIRFAGYLACVAMTFAVSTEATIIAFDIGPLRGLDGDGGLSQTSYASVNFDANAVDDVWNHMGQTPGATEIAGIQDLEGTQFPSQP